MVSEPVWAPRSAAAVASMPASAQMSVAQTALTLAWAPPSAEQMALTPASVPMSATGSRLVLERMSAGPAASMPMSALGSAAALASVSMSASVVQVAQDLADPG